MSLPHLKTTYFINKNTYENNMAKRRNFEESCREIWNETARYFKENDVASNKHNEWSSGRYVKSADYRGQRNNSAAALRHDIRDRKARLALLLESDRQTLKEDLEAELRNKDVSVAAMRSQAMSLRSAREEERRNKAEQLYFEHFRRNNPDLREVERQMIRDDAVNQWPAQIREKEEEMIRKKALDRQMEALETARRTVEDEEDKERFRQRIVDERHHKDGLRRQIDEMKVKEDEMRRLRLIEERLISEKLELEELDRSRREQATADERKEYGRALLRQHAAALRRKSQKIKEEMEADLKFLSYLASKDEQETEIQSARKTQAKSDILWMKQEVENKLQIEKEREAELDVLFAEEAARLWTKREQEWDRERAARQRLMNEVTEERLQQIKDRITDARQQQMIGLKEREELLREIERDKKVMAQQIEAEKQKKWQLRSNIEGQISDKRRQDRDDRLRKQLDLEMEANDEQAYSMMLQQETSRMREKGLTTRGTARR